jgi:carbon storage regulator
VLVLTRKADQAIRISDDIYVNILSVKGSSVRIGIDAPPNITIVRGELSAKELPKDGNKETKD